MLFSMVKHEWILQFCGKCFYGGLQTTLESLNVRIPNFGLTLACLWVHHNVSTLKSRANKMPKVCMPPRHGGEGMSIIGDTETWW
jgi:hypothetical protein